MAGGMTHRPSALLWPVFSITYGGAVRYIAMPKLSRKMMKTTSHLPILGGRRRGEVRRLRCGCGDEGRSAAAKPTVGCC